MRAFQPCSCVAIVVVASVGFFACGPLARSAAGSATTKPAVTMIPLPGQPFGVACSNDGSIAFVAVSGIHRDHGIPDDNGIVMLQLRDQKFEVKRLVPLQNEPAGLALTHDGKTLIAACGDSTDLLNIERMASGAGDPLVASVHDGTDSAIEACASKDDHWLFVSDEGAKCISVIDLARVKSGGFDQQALVGKIPTGWAPVALGVSPDGRLLYSTCQFVDEDKPGGAIVVADVAKATSDPAHSVVARIRAGNQPVRLIVSEDGNRVFVSERRINRVAMFDAGKLLNDSAHALLAIADVGEAPVPLALVRHGKILVVGNSNRFAADPTKPQTLSLLSVESSGLRYLKDLPAGAFPREMCQTPDGQFLLITNFLSNELEIVDTTGLGVE